MKLAVSALLLSSVAGFSMDMKYPKPKSAAKMAGVPEVASAYKQAWSKAGPSQALPYATAPPTLDGSMVGDFGFDPFGLSIQPPAVPSWATGPNGSPDGLTWLREAELMHGRIAQLAVVGFIAPGLFGTLPGNEWTGVDAYSYTNPLEAIKHVPGLAIAQIVCFMLFLEFLRVDFIRQEGAGRMAGDLRIGQGEGRYNPFGLDYTPEQYEEKRLQELKHCRLAMIGVIGLWIQAAKSGVSVVDQLSAGLTIPAYAAKAGYFLPEGI